MGKSTINGHFQSHLTHFHLPISDSLVVKQRKSTDARFHPFLISLSSKGLNTQATRTGWTWPNGWNLLDGLCLLCLLVIRQLSWENWEHLPSKWRFSSWENHLNDIIMIYRPAGWWFGTWFFPHVYLYIYWEFHDPNWRTPSFFRGVGLNHQPANQWMARKHGILHGSSLRTKHLKLGTKNEKFVGFAAWWNSYGSMTFCTYTIIYRIYKYL
jgi:hypothetical protein